MTTKQIGEKLREIQRATFEGRKITASQYTTLRDALLPLLDRLDVYEKALDWYADKSNWADLSLRWARYRDAIYGANGRKSVVKEADGGDIARAALKVTT